MIKHHNKRTTEERQLATNQNIRQRVNSASSSYPIEVEHHKVTLILDKQNELTFKNLG
jgi:translation elongation factor P/translation initiation factor 5A